MLPSALLTIIPFFISLFFILVLTSANDVFSFAIINSLFNPNSFILFN